MCSVKECLVGYNIKTLYIYMHTCKHNHIPVNKIIHDNIYTLMGSGTNHKAGSLSSSLIREPMYS